MTCALASWRFKVSGIVNRARIALDRVQFVSVLVPLVIVWGTAMCSHAQSVTDAIAGTVTDTSNAAIPGAVVTVSLASADIRSLKRVKCPARSLSSDNKLVEQHLSRCLRSIRMIEPRACFLKNSELSVEVVPAEGGRISSLKSLHSGMEFPTQSQRNRRYLKAGLGARFQDGPCAGIEECLPTVGVCGPDTEGGVAPDHGDFWQLPWKLLTSSNSYASLVAVGFGRTLGFSKKLTLDHDSLRVAYTVVNSGSTPQSFLYACRPLFAVSVGDRILLPGEIRELKLDYSKGNRLGESGSVLTWPTTKSAIHLDVTPGPEAEKAEMLYTPRLNNCIYGIYRGSSGQVIEVSCDAGRLPYLGLLLCYGGWPSDGEEPRQYAVALEPTSSHCNMLANAQRTHTAISLMAGETDDWEILFRIIKRGTL